MQVMDTREDCPLEFCAEIVNSRLLEIAIEKKLIFSMFRWDGDYSRLKSVVYIWEVCR
jgi:hypothetical protein